MPATVVAARVYMGNKLAIVNTGSESATLKAGLVIAGFGHQRASEK